MNDYTPPKVATDTDSLRRELMAIARRDGITDRERIVLGAAIGALANGAAAMQDEAVEAMRQAFCGLQRYSFHTDGQGGVRRVPDSCGRWVELDAAHALFDPVIVDAAIAKLMANKAIATVAGARAA